MHKENTYKLDVPYHQYEPSKVYKQFKIDRIYTVHFFDNFKDYSFQGEYHDFWELTYMEKGTILYKMGNQEDYSNLNKTQMLLIPPNVPHIFDFTQENQNFSLCLVSFSCRKTEAMKLLEKHNVFEYDHDFQVLFSSLIREARQAFSEPLSKIMRIKIRTKQDALPFCFEKISILTELLLIAMYRQVVCNKTSSITQDKKQTNILERTTKFLKANVRNRITLDDVSEEIGMSKSQIQKVFRKEVGTSIIRYYNELKVDEAKYFLRQNAYSLKEIADILNYNNVHYFSSSFKKIEGISPSSYSKSLKAWIENDIKTHPEFN